MMLQQIGHARIGASAGLHHPTGRQMRHRSIQLLAAFAGLVAVLDILLFFISR